MHSVRTTRAVNLMAVASEGTGRLKGHAHVGRGMIERKLARVEAESRTRCARGFTGIEVITKDRVTECQEMDAQLVTAASARCEADTRPG